MIGFASVIIYDHECPGGSAWTGYFHDMNNAECQPPYRFEECYFYGGCSILVILAVFTNNFCEIIVHL